MKIYHLLSIALLSYSCSIKTEISNTGMLPDSRPEDFVLKSHTSGGMRNTSKDLYISKDSSSFLDNNFGEVTVKKFKVSSQQLDSLYSILKSNKFDQIEVTIDTATLDRGGISVDVYWNNNHDVASVSDASQSFVNREWYSQWGTILKYLDNLAGSTL